MNASEQHRHTTVTARLSKQLDDLTLVVANEDQRLADLAQVVKALVAEVESLVARTDVRVTLHTRQIDDLQGRIASMAGWQIHWSTLTLWNRFLWLVTGDLG